MFLFAVVFMDTAATIPTGAMAERWKFSAFLHLRPLHVDVPVSALRELGLGRRLAFATRSQPRAGTRACRFRRIIGGAHDRRHNRTGRRHRARAANRQVSPRRPLGAIPGHNMPMAMIGTLILAFGWFGFNAGSTLGGLRPAHRTDRGEYDGRSAAGALSSLFYLWFRFHKTRRRDGLQRIARRTGRNHRAVRIRHHRWPR